MMDCPQYYSDQLSIFDDLPVGILINVEDGSGGLRYGYSNRFLAVSLGYEPDEFAAMLTKQCFAAIYEADREKTKRARSKVESGQVVNSMTRQKKKDGSVVWILAQIRRIRLDDSYGMIFFFSGIQELIGLQNELSAKNKTWSDIMQSVPIGLLVFKVEKGIINVLSVNRILLKLADSAGKQLDSQNRAWTESEIITIINQDFYFFCKDDDVYLVEEMLKASETQSDAGCIFRLRGSEGEATVYIQANCSSKENGEDSRTYYVTFQNVTESEKRRLELIEKQGQLLEMSYYDAMTGVKNRNAYNEFAGQCRNNYIYNVGMAFCDINGLKKTNDTLGHYYGDKLIRLFASILKEYFDVDNIYRLNGDEFVVICPGIGQQIFQDKMDELLVRVRNEECIASIGYIWKEKVSNIQRRTTQAEQIMYVEKQRYYENSRTVNSKHRPRMLNTILSDFAENRFVMFLQPKTSIDGSRVIGAEALARKYDQDGNLVLPYEFVPQLENEKMISKLDYFMLEQTCIFLQEQHEKGNEDFSVSVNVSRVTIAENDFMNNVASILEKYDFDRSDLEIELTESNKTLDSARLEKYLGQLKQLGVEISLDDMGNDYSTLSLLTIEGFDWVKLDRSLIIQLDQKKACVLVKHIINTCHDLDLKVIAEGVETDDVRALLQDMGCDAYQGYLKSKPIPADEFKTRFLD